jgi:HAE1 family hydrophobic/amphiphilic exporter-1
MMCSRFLRHHDASQENVFGRFLEGCFQLLLRGYDHSLRVVLKYQFPTLLVLFATMAGSAYLFQSIPKGFFPIEDTGFITGKTEGLQGSGFQNMVELQQRAAAIVAADPAVEMINSSVGQSGITSTLNTGSLFIGLKPADQRPPVQQVIQRLRGKLAGIPGLNIYMQPVQSMNIGGRPSKSQYQYTLQAGELDELYKWANTMQGQIAKLPGVQDVTTDMQIATPNAQLAVDMDRAQSLGIDNTTLRDTLFSSFGTRQVADIYSAFSDTPVILEVDPKYQENSEGLKHIYVRSSIPTANTGKLVPLDGFVSFKQSVGPSSVSHQGQLPSVTISFNLQPGVALGQAVDGISEIERQVAMPATVTTSFQGSAQVFQQATAGQAMLLATAIAVIYIILGVLYESFIHPITILTGLPSAALGALLTLQLFHMDLSVIAMIGIVMLIGIVKKNAIMMIDFALQQKQAGETDPVKAMYQACIMRFRPIMMTSFACIFGTLPIALGAGAGSELRRPLGVAVVGGLIVSQVLTLYITPVVFVYFERLMAYMRSGTQRPDEMHAMHGTPAE